MNSQYRKNLKDAMTSCKNYTDAEIAKSEEKMKWYMGEYSISTSDDNTSASTKTVPANATRCKIKRIYGLTQKLNPTTASDSTSYSVKTMPATVYDFDVSKVEGKSEKSENLIVVEDGNINAQGMTFAFLNGVCNSSGTPSSTGWISIKRIVLQAGTYYFKDFSTASNKMRIIDSNYNAKTTQPFTLNAETTMFLAITGQSITDNGQLINSMPMLVSGSSEPTTYKQGYTGIHNFAWTGVKVEGENIFDKTAVTLDKALSASTGTISDDSNSFVSDYIEVEIGSTYNYNLGVQFGTSFYDSNKTFLSGGSYLTFTIPSDAKYIRMSAYKTRLDTLMISKGSTIPTTYQPYITPTTTTIDLSSILYNGSPLFEGNSLKAVNDVKDSVTPYKATKKLGYVDLGSLNYTLTVGNRFYAVLPSGFKTILTSEIYNAICSIYNVVSRDDVTNANMNLSISKGTAEDDNNNYVNIINTSYNDATTFKTAMAGVYLVYELATAIEVSINWASLLRGITGYSNGTISLLNTNNQDTANLITYNSIIKENCCAKMVQSRGGNVIKTINLPTQASDGWSAGSVYNYRDYTTNKRETGVNKVDLGNGSYTAQYNAFYTYAFTGYAYQEGTVKFISAKYESFNYTGSLSNFVATDKSITFTSATMLWFTDKQYGTDAATAKTANAGNNLYYALSDASKTSTDITPIDNVLEVQPNDTLAFYDANDNLVTIQSDLTYRIEVES